MRNLIFTGFGGFERGLSILKNSKRNHKRRINKCGDFKVINLFSQNKVAQMGKQMIFSVNKARANNYIIGEASKYLFK